MTFDEWWKTTYRKQGRVAAEQSWQASRKVALEEAAEYADKHGGCGLLPHELREMAEENKK